MDNLVKKIFILDDTITFLSKYKSYEKHFNLRNVEFTLLTSDWNELLEHKSLKEASLILIDYSLGDNVNGFDVAKECKKIATNAKVKIVTASLKRTLENWKKNPTYSELCEVSDIIEKPITLKIFADLIDSVG